MRASDPVLVTNIVKGRKSGLQEENQLLSRGPTMKKVDENYFGKHFAATPKAQITEEQ